MEALLAADPDFGMAHCLKGYLFLMGFRADALGAARAALADARRCPGTAREKAHEAALAHWIDGDPERAAAVWDQILRDHPHDILAFRLAHFLNFWGGRAEAMLASVLVGRASLERRAAWLSARCWRAAASPMRRAGYYLEAEQAGREACGGIQPICGRHMAWRMCWK